MNARFLSFTALVILGGLSCQEKESNTASPPESEAQSPTKEASAPEPYNQEATRAFEFLGKRTLESKQAAPHTKTIGVDGSVTISKSDSEQP